MSILLGSSYSAVFLNGARGKWFKHWRGLRQGDPLSLMLFILAMEPLQRLLELATTNGAITQVAHRSAKLRISMYADDAAIFLNPILEEVREVAYILSVFGNASGLLVNVAKSACFPIRCEDLDLHHTLQFFNCPIKSFPCAYLGLPLHYRKLGRVEVQPLIEKVAARLPTWKGRLLSKIGRLRLVNAVLTSIPVHFLTVFPLQKWALKKIDRVRRSFLWKGAADANGGHCLVRWAKTNRPKKFGGLGILDLELFSRALRLRWLWLEWTEQDRPWVGMEVPCDSVDRQLFRASTVCVVGDGRKASFWKSSWLDGRAPMDIAPGLFKFAWRKNRKVREELQDQSWTRGLWRMNTVQEMVEFVTLWDLVQQVTLTD